MRTKAASGGSYFIDIASWIPDLNHILIANQPPLYPFPPSFYFWHHAPPSLFLSLRVSQLYPFPLCVSYREIIHEEEPRRTLAALGFHWTSFPLHLFANHLSRVRVFQYIYISSYKSSIMHRLCISYLFIYFSSYSLFRCLARPNRSFFSFLLARGDNIT